MKSVEDLVARLKTAGSPWVGASAAKPLIMGILNLTPDSFSDGGKFYRQKRVDCGAVVETAWAMVEQGAEILDLGAESTRPGAPPVNPDEEEKRLLPVLQALQKKGPSCWLSLDSRRAALAEKALNHGVHILNDVSAGRDDRAMLALMAGSPCLSVLMHRHGNSSAQMQQAPHYADVCTEVGDFLLHRAQKYLDLGGKADRLILDPGIGFGKTLAHNLKLLAGLSDLNKEYALLLGHSRKQFINQISPSPPPQRLGGSIAALLVGVEAGAAILRVHDVSASIQAIRVWQAIRSCRGAAVT